MAEAIWWSINKHTRYLHARGKHGTATLCCGRNGAELVRYDGMHEGMDNGDHYSSGNANPRRQNNNTITRKQALKLSADMIKAAEVRISESRDMFKHDPLLRDLYREQSEARFVHYAMCMQRVLADNPDPASWIERHSTSEHLIWDAANNIAEAMESGSTEDNPWLKEDRQCRQYGDRDTWEQEEETKRKRILFVVCNVK